MNKTQLKETLKVVKDLIMFDSAWNKRNKIKQAKKLPKGALRRIQTYRDLVKSSFYEVLSNIYPDTHKLLDKEWNNLISKYIEKYPPNSPILTKVAERFPLFLSEEKNIQIKYPFLSELALYEWLEVDIYGRETRTKTNGHFLNPASEICNFNYPIPEIAERVENKKPLGKQKPSPTNVLIYRDPKNLTIRFIELSEGTIHYLLLLKKGYTNDKIKRILAKHYNIDTRHLKTFNHEIQKLVKDLKNKRILV